MENLDLSSALDAITAIFNDLEGFGDVLKQIVAAFLSLGEMFKDF